MGIIQQTSTVNFINFKKQKFWVPGSQSMQCFLIKQTKLSYTCSIQT